jgi:hypothetical protein
VDDTVQLQLSITLGDLVVAGATITAIIGAYFAVKAQLVSSNERLNACDRRAESHERRLDGHDDDLDRIEEQLFGRRKSDRRSRRQLTAGT